MGKYYKCVAEVIERKLQSSGQVIRIIQHQRPYESKKDLAPKELDDNASGESHEENSGDDDSSDSSASLGFSWGPETQPAQIEFEDGLRMMRDIKEHPEDTWWLFRDEDNWGPYGADWFLVRYYMDSGKQRCKIFAEGEAGSGWYWREDSPWDPQGHIGWMNDKFLEPEDCDSDTETWSALQRNRRER